jgi:hypothetical protein
MKNYIGKKIRGFKYKNNTDGLKWIEEMTWCIGKIGEIKYQHSKFVGVFIDGYYWQYPISLVDEHLVEDEMYGIEFSPISLTIDNVNHPSHYGGSENKYEAIRVIEAWKSCFHIGNVLKYLSRAGKKGEELEDLKKAMWYLKRKIDLLEGKE